jgi:hypothetical protein
MNEGRFKSRLLTLQARFSQALKGYELTHMDLPLDGHSSYDSYDYENSVTFLKQLLEYSLQSGE